MDLPNPEDVLAQYDAGEIDLETLVRQMSRHLILLDKFKEIDIIALSGLMQDIKFIAAVLNVVRPSQAQWSRLERWRQQAEAASTALTAQEDETANKGPEAESSENAGAM
jgi:hypothetical protein